MLDKKQICGYLKRIGLDEKLVDARRDYELLKKLQLAHVLTVPYENLDILENKPLKLDPASLYEKIVTRGRGGYCFELNGIFKELLLSMGFEVKDYMARYLRGESGIPMRRHRVLVVTVPEGRILCDTAIGDTAARLPLIMEDGLVQEQFGESYRLTTDPFYGHVVSDLHRGEWRAQYAFTEEEQIDTDYEMPSFFCEKHPSSPFNKEYMLAIKTLTGRKTVSGNVFRIFDGDSVEEKTLDDGEIADVFKKHFGL